MRARKRERERARVTRGLAKKSSTKFIAALKLLFIVKNEATEYMYIYTRMRARANVRVKRKTRGGRFFLSLALSTFSGYLLTYSLYLMSLFGCV